MSTRYGVPLVACLLPFTGAAQVLCALGSGASNYKASADQRPSPDAMQLVGRANAGGATVCGSNCPEVVLFRIPTASNVMLIVDAGRAPVEARFTTPTQM